MEETKPKGTLYYVGLRNRQVLVILSTNELRIDGGWWTFTTPDDEIISVRPDDVVYTREREVDIPDDSEVAELIKRVLSGFGADQDSDDHKVLGQYL